MRNAPEPSHHLEPGYLLIAKKPMLVSGVVGSGMFVALWDSRRRYSGCCCYLLARSRFKSRPSARCGDQAIDRLVRCMADEGSPAADLRAILVGAAVTPANPYGAQTRTVAGDSLARHGIPILTEDTGGEMGRKFVYNPVNAESIVMKVNHLRKQDWHPYR
jgi:chemotaxis protein CheD